MTVSREEWEKGGGLNTGEILMRLFLDHPDTAYSMKDISAALGRVNQKRYYTLTDLVAIGKLEVGIMRDEKDRRMQKYWILKKKEQR